jgi:hypothetical protein
MRISSHIRERDPMSANLEDHTDDVSRVGTNLFVEQQPPACRRTRRARAQRARRGGGASWQPLLVELRPGRLANRVPGAHSTAGRGMDSTGTSAIGGRVEDLSVTNVCQLGNKLALDRAELEVALMNASRL